MHVDGGRNYLSTSATMAARATIEYIPSGAPSILKSCITRGR